MSAIIISSCPGKVLIAGGYTILEQENSGLVFSTSARMKTSLKSECNEQQDDGRINVYSKSFREMYSFSYGPNAVVQYDEESLENTFVASAVRCALLWVVRKLNMHHTDESDSGPFRPLPLRTLNMIIDADAQFHGHQAENSSDADSAKPRKTGLGSSATLTASLISALVLHFYTTDPLSLLMIAGASGKKVLFCTDKAMRPDVLRREIHFVSQVAHNIAQGKIGSGFDVCCAVFGSGVYRRYAPACLAGCLFENDWTPSGAMIDLFDRFLSHERDLLEKHEEADQKNERISAPVMDYNFEPLSRGYQDDFCAHPVSVKSPADLHMLLIASHQSTSTPKMASIFNAKRDTFKDLYQSLVHANHRFIALWKDLLSNASDYSSEAFQSKIQHTFRLIRCYLKEIGEMAQIPIEPDVSTRLLNDIQELDGVICAGCPGAGGFDAMFAIVKGDAQRDAVAEMVKRTYGETFTPMDIDIDLRGGLCFDFVDVGE